MATRWWRGSLWILGFGCLWLNVCDDPPLESGACLRDVTQTGATVAVIRAASCRAEVVVEASDGAVVARVAQPESRRRHALRIEGLQPGAEYRYRLLVDGSELDRGRIRTAPADDRPPIRFAFCGDSGDQPWWVWLQRTPLWHLPARWGVFADSAAVTAVGAAMAAWEPDFALHLGDIVYPKGLHAHYRTGFFRPFAALLRNAPVYAALGNHDVMDAGGLQALANVGGPAGALTGDARCYSVIRGPLRVIVLDGNSFGLADPHLEEHPAFRYLQDELQRATEPWIVVATHFPIRSASRAGNRGDLMKHLQPLLQREAVSLYLSGHDHCYQRFGRPENGEVPLVVSGGGGKDLYAVRPDRQVAVATSAYHWCEAQCEGTALKVRSHGLDGRILDEFVVTAPGGEPLESLRRERPGRAARIDALRQR